MRGQPQGLPLPVHRLPIHTEAVQGYTASGMANARSPKPADLSEVSDVVILRLPMYVRALSQLLDAGNEVVDSRALGRLIRIAPAQVRKDLSYLGKFGKQGQGYSVPYLRDELRRILGLDRSWTACLVGVGNLGQAIIDYPGFAPAGFRIVAAFDSDPGLVGKRVRDIPVRPMSELGGAVDAAGITIGIVAVPASQAQSVIDGLVQAGVRGILNYAPVAPHVPECVILRNIDPVLSLQSMTYYMLEGSRPD